MRVVHFHQKFHHTHYLYPRTPFYNTFLLFHTMSIALAFYCIRTSNPFPYFEVQLKYMILRGKIEIEIRSNLELIACYYEYPVFENTVIRAYHIGGKIPCNILTYSPDYVHNHLLQPKCHKNCCSLCTL